MLILLNFLSAIFLLVYVALIITFISGWLRLKESDRISVTGLLKVSVLIAARNEEACILNCLNDILAQEYPSYLIEIIVVDDHSTDLTSETILSLRSGQIKLIRLNETKALNSYKKKAITEAIKLSTGELIITTDADCRMGYDWISSIVSLYEQDSSKLISAPVTFFAEKGTFQKIQTLEFITLIAMGASAIGNKMPFTCNGANMAYSKAVFLELDGFQGIDHIASGDDELFLHKVAAAYPDQISFLKSRKAIVYTYAKDNLVEFIKQRKRWASKSMKYKNKLPVFVSVLVYLFYLSILLNFVGGVFYPLLLKMAVIELFIKLAIDALFFYLAAKFFNRRNYLFLLVQGSLLHIFYILYIGVIARFGTYEWKDRMVK